MGAHFHGCDSLNIVPIRGSILQPNTYKNDNMDLGLMSNMDNENVLKYPTNLPSYKNLKQFEGCLGGLVG